MKKLAAFFTAAVVAVTLIACADRTALSEETPDAASVSAGITDLEKN